MEDTNRRAHRPLSCLPCRRHKLKCNRHVPCQACIRYCREDRCLEHPAFTSSVSTISRQALRPRRSVEVSVGGPVGVPFVVPAETSPVSYGAHQQQHQSTPHTTSDYGRSSPAAKQQIRHNERLIVSVLPSIDSIANGDGDINRPESYWRSQLVAVLPTHNQCDMLVSFFLENINWLYHAVHVPSFRKAYNKFWNADPKEVDLSWMALLFAMIAQSALFVSADFTLAMGLSPRTIRDRGHKWYYASRQSLHTDGFESKPKVIHIQTFIVSQMYWQVTKNVEVLNSCMGQAVRAAQALGLDKGKEGSNPLETQLRRRTWWDLWVCDSFQSCCLSRAPLIQIHESKVPFPANCDDDDLSTNSVVQRPWEQPTETSFLIMRAQIFAVMQKLFVDNCAQLSNYEHVQKIDQELMQVADSFPWYARIKEDESGTPALPTDIDHISWAHHILHSCICLQRIRMYRPFLHPPLGNAASICADNAKDVLSVYFLIRSAQLPSRPSPKFVVHSYQVYSAAVAIAAFLLVERTFPHHNLRIILETIISDLDYRDIAEPHILAVDGARILRKMLQLYDRREGRDPRESETLAPAIASVFGGEETASSYLRHEQRNGKSTTGATVNEATATDTLPGGSPTRRMVRSIDPCDSGVPSTLNVEPLDQRNGMPQLVEMSPFNQWSDDDLAFLNEIFNYPQGDVLASQFLIPS